MEARTSQRPGPGSVSAASAPGLQRVRRAAVPVLVIVLTLLVGIGWSLSSPLSSSPDDDYHLGSIWCPRPAQSSCETSQLNGVPVIRVPRAVSDTSMHCFVFSAQSAGCVVGYDDDDTVWSTRFDDGDYPVGYYRLHHFLVGHDVELSAVLMRVLNVLLCVALVAVLVLLAPRKEVPAVWLVPLLSWTPMGLYFIASNNPTSWAVSGLFAYCAGLYLATRAKGYRRVGLLAAGLVGALMCLGSRYDAAFYLFIVGVALLVAVRWRRGLWPELAAVVVCGVLGLVEMLSSGRTDAMPGEAPGGIGAGFLYRLLVGIETIPKYLGGFWGLHWVPGWGDVPLHTRSPFVLVILAAGGIVFLALRSGTWRTWAPALVLIGSAAVLPAVFHAAGVFMPIEAYQARYVLPLLAPALLMLLVADKDEPLRLSRPQAVWTGLCLVGCHVIAQHTVMMRYVKGVPEQWPLNLDESSQWWWDVPFGPMTLLAVCSCAFAVLVTTALTSATSAGTWRAPAGDPVVVGEEDA
ncbi:DUF2142 domain-containing protein [Actinomyces sp. W5033]|uniref:DUF2142 domain-containing protein n=1 Tax=Actinomyces sp. W5033 TaxID=3446479 RepID=UPI003EE3C3B4